MGLSLLADVARSAGARLELRSAPGLGTTVRVGGVPLLTSTEAAENGKLVHHMGDPRTTTRADGGTSS